MSAIVVENLTKTYKAINALDSLGLTVEKGEIFGLLGPNGAGKTTLISILTGLLLPDSGKVELLGMDIVRQRSEVQERINLVTGFTGAINGISVINLLRYYAMLYRVKDAEPRIAELLKTVELEERKDQFASTLSTGLRQRFYLAKALLNKPEILFLDEPTVGLDVGMAIKIRGLIMQLKMEGYTIFLTTHYMHEAEQLCDRIALINDGKIVALGTPKELKEMVREETIIEIQTTQPQDIRDVMKRIAGVGGVSWEGRVVKARVTEFGTIKPIMKALLEANVKLDSVSVVEPSLEEVFLKLTSRRILEEGESEV